MATKKTVSTRGGRGSATQRKKSGNGKGAVVTKSGKGAAIAIAVFFGLSIVAMLVSTIMCLKSIGIIGGGKNVKPKPTPVTSSAPVTSTSSQMDGAMALSAADEGGIMVLANFVTCADCGNRANFTRVAEEPSCLGTGSSVYHCDYCDEDIVKADISALGHTDPVASTRVESTCTTAGYQAYKCTRCNNEIKRDPLAINSSNHNVVAGTRVEPTCTTTGYQAYKCSRCGKETSRTTLAALSHNLSQLVDDTEFYKTYQCSMCNLHVVSFNKTPIKEGHTFAGWYYGNGENCGESCRAYIGEAFYSDTDFHAHFNINTMEVSYVSDDEEISSEYIDWGTTANPITPEKTGYNFEGWYLADGTKYEGQAIKSNTTLTAKWTIIRLTLNFYVGGTLYTSIEVDYGTAMETLAAQAEANYLNVLSVMDESGEIADYSEGVITSSIRIEAARMSTLMSVATFVKLNWYWGFVFILGVIGLASTVVLAITKGKRRNADKR